MREVIHIGRFHIRFALAKIQLPDVNRTLETGFSAIALKAPERQILFSKKWSPDGEVTKELDDRLTSLLKRNPDLNPRTW